MALTQYGIPSGQHAGLTKGTPQCLGGVLGGWTAEVWTITLASTWAAADTLLVTVSKLDDGGNVISSASLTHTSTSSTLATIAAAAVDELQADAVMGSYGAWTSSGAVITFTGTERYAFTVACTATTAGSGTATAANGTDYADASDVAPGRAVRIDSYAGAVALMQAPVAADYTARSVTYTVVPASGAIYSGELTINGVTYPIGDIPYNASATQTNADIATAVETILNAAGDATYNAVCTSTASTVVVTVDVAGAGADLEFILRSNGTATTEPTAKVFAGTTILDDLAGFLPRMGAQRGYLMVSDALVHPGGSQVNPVRNGEICLIPAGTTPPSAGSALWISVAAADAGACYSSGAANRVRLPLSVARSTADGYYRIDLGA